jgi:hypothetical protein
MPIPGVPIRVPAASAGRREPLGPGQPRTAAGEHVGGLDHVVLDPAGHGDDLVHPAPAVAVQADLDHQVDAGRHGGDDEPAAHVLPGQQRQRAHLGHRLPGRIRVQGAHPGQPGVERQQEVQRLGLPHLADDQPVGAHPQRLLDQPAQRYLAGALQARLAALHPDRVPQADLQLEHLFAGHHPLPRRDRGDQAVQQRGLAGLGAPGDEDVQPGLDRRGEEGGGLRGDRAQADQVVQPGRPGHVLSDVHRPVRPGDVRDDDVQPGPVGECGVDERAAQVHPAAGGLEHPLDQVTDLDGGQDRGRELVQAAPGDEHLARLVDPDLLDRGVVEVGLQRAVAGHLVQDQLDRAAGVRQRRQGAGERALVVVGDGVLDQPTDPRRVVGRVQATATDQLAHLVGHDGDGVHPSTSPRTRPSSLPAVITGECID